jgi:hypothetical protein
VKPIVYVPFMPPNHVIVDILYSNTIGGDYPGAGCVLIGTGRPVLALRQAVL